MSGTAIDITPRGEKTELRFTHKGLVLTIECYPITGFT